MCVCVKGEMEKMGLLKLQPRKQSNLRFTEAQPLCDTSNTARETITVCLSSLAQVNHTTLVFLLECSLHQEVGYSTKLVLPEVEWLIVNHRRVEK